jgi:hypothetical protein
MRLVTFDDLLRRVEILEAKEAAREEEAAAEQRRRYAIYEKEIEHWRSIGAGEGVPATRNLV